MVLLNVHVLVYYHLTPSTVNCNEHPYAKILAASIQCKSSTHRG